MGIWARGPAVGGPLQGRKAMAHKGRKPGDWKSVAAGRAAVPRIMVKGHGLSNIPGMNETGSAAYRRLADKKNKYGN